MSIKDILFGLLLLVISIYIVYEKATDGYLIVGIMLGTIALLTVAEIFGKFLIDKKFPTSATDFIDAYFIDA